MTSKPNLYDLFSTPSYTVNQDNAIQVCTHVISAYANQFKNNKEIKGDLWETFCINWLYRIKGCINVWKLGSKYHPCKISDELEKKLNIPDTDYGIDLIGQLPNYEYVAVQCKFLSSDSTKKFSWQTLSTFVGLCAITGPWSEHLIITNQKIAWPKKLNQPKNYLIIGEIELNTIKPDDLLTILKNDVTTKSKPPQLMIPNCTYPSLNNNDICVKNETYNKSSNNNGTSPQINDEKTVSLEQNKSTTTVKNEASTEVDRILGEFSSYYEEKTKTALHDRDRFHIREFLKTHKWKKLAFFSSDLYKIYVRWYMEKYGDTLIPKLPHFTTELKKYTQFINIYKGNDNRTLLTANNTDQLHGNYFEHIPQETLEIEKLTVTHTVLQEIAKEAINYDTPFNIKPYIVDYFRYDIMSA